MAMVITMSMMIMLNMAEENEKLRKYKRDGKL